MILRRRRDQIGRVCPRRILFLWVLLITYPTTARAFSSPSLVSRVKTATQVPRGRTYTKRTTRSDHSIFAGQSQRKVSQVDDHQNEDRGHQEEDDPAGERRAGILVLLTVPMAWGTFEPAVRYVYDVQPNVPPFAFQLVYYVIATSALAILASSPLFARTLPEKAVETQDTTTSSQWSLVSIQGGVELGTYLFLGNAMQVVGLKTIPSDRAAFLLQLTTIFVPVVQSLVARNISALRIKTWAACFMALAGVGCIGLDGPSNTHNDLSNQGLVFSAGDVYIVLAALFYTFHCIRLEAYAKTTPAVQLALAKASTETFWSGLVILLALLAANMGNANPSALFDMAHASGENIMAYKESLMNSLQDTSITSEQWAKLAAATTWIALVTISYTLTAQSYGQARVPPATANLIYTVQPLFTALIAFLVLGETLGPAGYGGGFLIGSAVVLTIQDEPSGPATDTQ